MALLTSTILGIAAVGSSLLGVNAQRHGAKEAGKANDRARVEQEKAQGEEKALNAQRASLERRQQIREERVARGKLMQGSENTGTSGSSGESGAQAGLANQLGANIGFNLGQLQGTNAIGTFNQNAANYQGDAQKALSDAQTKAGLFSLAASSFDKTSTIFADRGK